MSVIECRTPQDWLATLQSRYDISMTTLNVSASAFTVLILKGNTNIIIGRYDRTRSYGVVICRRFQHNWVEYNRRAVKDINLR